MHRHRHSHSHHHHHGHDHHHDHEHDPDHAAAHNRTPEPHGGPGHNQAGPPRAVAQWQTPHRPQGSHEASAAPEPDLDKVESAFVEGFLAASDQTSFLRLARIPFLLAEGGTQLHLLRVEIDAVTDVGSLTPHLGGGSFRYDPLPAGLVSQRRRLRFVYFDGKGLRSFGYAELREADRSV